MPADQNRLVEAMLACRKAAKANPTSARIQYRLANCHAALGDVDDAIAAFRRTIALEPDFAEAHFRLGSMLSETGDISEGFAHYMLRAVLAHRTSSAQFRRTPEPLHKIKHDSEQQQYLAARFGQQMSFFLEDGARIPGRATNPAVDAAVIGQWKTTWPQFVVLDNFLLPEALDRIRLYCAGSTIWRKSYEAGYLGATPEDGFACPLLAQIVEEVPILLPQIVGPHPFRYLGAFKYDSTLSTGTNLHADNSAVNLNLYITPDEANLDPGSGGMDIWDVAVPQGEDMGIYNRNERLARKFLLTSTARRTSIPHRANRAILFKSDLFHKTSDCRFREGYLNRRMNISILFGYRGAPTR